MSLGNQVLSFLPLPFLFAQDILSHGPHQMSGFIGQNQHNPLNNFQVK